MEKFLFTSRNFLTAKRKGRGELNLMEKIRSISAIENVFTEAEIPDFEIILHWEECTRPLADLTAFLPLISPKLYAYKYHYLGSFEKNKSKIEFGNQNSSGFCEKFSAKLHDRNVFSFEDINSSQCNLTWLLDFLMKADKISSDALRDEKLIWLRGAKGFELILESQSFDKKISERQVFYFQNNFESVSWQHNINIR